MTSRCNMSTIHSTITSDKAKHIDVPFHNSREPCRRYDEGTTAGVASVSYSQHWFAFISINGPIALSVSAYTHTLTGSVPRAHFVKRFLHLYGSGIHAETKSLSFFIGFIGSMSLSFSHCMALFFLIRVSPTGFTAEVLMKPLGLYVFPFFHPLWRFFMSFGLAYMLAAPECSKRGSVAISHLFSFVTCRITSSTCIQTFHFSCLSL